MMPVVNYQLRRNPDGYSSITPAPTANELGKFYSEQYYQSLQTVSYQESYDALEINYKTLKCSALLHAIRQAGVSDGKFLDIGAGEGFLMNEATKCGYDIMGIDFSSFALDRFFPHLAEKLISGDLYEVLGRLRIEGRRFSVCSAINVLEHVIDPELFLSLIRRLMVPGALLAITVPNDFSKLHELLRTNKMIDRDFWVSPPQHLHYFNSENLQSFLCSQGFDLLDAYSDFPIDWYLLHPGSNYVADPQNGKAAHRARLMLDLMIAESGIDSYLAVYRALFAANIGRDVTVLIRSAAN